MSKVYDLIIIGAGPAGMTAGVYAARKKLKTLIIAKDIGGQASWSSDIENYLGFSMITGPDLVKKFEDHLEEFKDDVELRLSISGVTKISKKAKNFSVVMGDGKKEEAKAIIIAGGKVPRELGVKGEKEFLNKGVAYCAWCDGPLFKGKDVAIIGGGNSALDAALNISKLVKQIFIVNLTPELTGDPVMIDKVKALPHIRIMNDMEVVEIEGERLVEKIRIKSRDGGLQKDLPVSGVFIEVGSLPATEYLDGLVKLNKDNEIVIDEYNSTTQEGIYAAGDITTVVEKQIITAAGEGAKAAIQASIYLAKK
ncbi:MAG: FAD-dependent oxidoreductase [Patescibacteria group bacterium]|jgi:alkyl hydroperoxide reductase subunit F|nr:FAD-dependent oxidoreductase [Patescibacteria group bacterium]